MEITYVPNPEAADGKPVVAEVVVEGTTPVMFPSPQPVTIVGTVPVSFTGSIAFSGSIALSPNVTVVNTPANPVPVQVVSGTGTQFVELVAPLPLPVVTTGTTLVEIVNQQPAALPPVTLIPGEATGVVAASTQTLVTVTGYNRITGFHGSGKGDGIFRLYDSGTMIAMSWITVTRKDFKDWFPQPVVANGIIELKVTNDCGNTTDFFGAIGVASV
jgi:hypothetical protein